MESVDVIIAAYGDREKWTPLAERAAASVGAQTVPARIIYQFDPDPVAILGRVRNLGALRSQADYLIFLDADDELDPGYIKAMTEEESRSDLGLMYWPSTIGVYEDGRTDDYPVLMEPRGSLLVHNWMVIGTMIPRWAFLEVGGFRDLPILEDWDLWIRLRLAGIIPAPCEEALYRVHVNPSSRNNPDIHGGWYTEIQQTYQAEWYAKGLP